MMTGWPSATVSFSPIVRARMSVVPPGANGTIHLIGFAGHVCAAADTQNTSATSPTARAIFFNGLPLRCSRDHRARALAIDADRLCGGRKIGPRRIVERDAVHHASFARFPLDVARRLDRLAALQRRRRLDEFDEARRLASNASFGIVDRRRNEN